MNPKSEGAVFPRSFAAHYPAAVRGEGVYVFDEQGKRYLDACGGAAVVAIGHGVGEVAEAIREQALRLSYVHSSSFTTAVAVELAEFLQKKFPGPAQKIRVHYTSGGSESTEAAIKIARQYWLSRGEPQRYKVLSRWHSFHGATLGALAVTGNRIRQEPFLPLLPPVDHIPACFCYHCPLEKEFPGCELACATELERAIERAGKETVAAFILEPVVGATSGAVPPEGYLRKIREICDAYGILLIADEVLTGVGRTGKYFAVEHWDVVPDMIGLGKGLTSGYAPLGAVLAGEKVWQTIRSGSGRLEHGSTYQGHPPSLAAGVAVQRYLEEHGLIEQARQRGDYLAQRLEGLGSLPGVGDVRGLGMLQSVEFVKDRSSRTPYPPEQRVADLVGEELMRRGVSVYPMRGTRDGVSGDHIMLAPPFVIEESEIDWLVSEIEGALTAVFRERLSA